LFILPSAAIKGKRMVLVKKVTAPFKRRGTLEKGRGVWDTKRKEARSSSSTRWGEKMGYPRGRRKKKRVSYSSVCRRRDGRKKRNNPTQPTPRTNPNPNPPPPPPPPPKKKNNPPPTEGSGFPLPSRFPHFSRVLHRRVEKKGEMGVARSKRKNKKKRPFFSHFRHFRKRKKRGCVATLCTEKGEGKRGKKESY